jgi:hypothetical protein
MHHGTRSNAGVLPRFANDQSTLLKPGRCYACSTADSSGKRVVVEAAAGAVAGVCG